mmetsp:Transcript_15057/g.24470  ORF Transcript_15057/g.24470 Transcript_15057/m.24470 type:complete len:156 (-) Transcript_15057:98-565(-)
MSATVDNRGPLPSLATVKFVLLNTGKAACVHGFILGVIALIGLVFSIVLGQDAVVSIRNVVFVVYQLTMIGHSAIGAMASLAQQDDVKQEVKSVVDKYTTWFSFAILASLMGPFVFVYWGTAHTMLCMLQCVVTQLLLKFVCFIGFPRETQSISQ